MLHRQEGYDVLIMRPRSAGFTLIELLTVMVVASIMFALAFPIVGNWLKNSQIRTVAESVQNGLRFAQVQAVTLSQETGFFLANDPPVNTTTAAAVSPADSWYSTTITTINGVANINQNLTANNLQTGRLGNVANGIQIYGPTGICFNSLGRLTANSTTGGGAICPAPTGNTVYTYQIKSSSSAQRWLNVTLNPNGQVRICDPAKILSNTNPDGC